MLLRLFLLLTVVPLVELVILLRIGEWLGWLPTLGLVIVTGALGAVLARREGLRTIARIREQLDRGEMPTEAMADGVLILIAGVVLITPGILTDLCGFALLIPTVRAWVRRQLSRAWHERVVVHTMTLHEESLIDDDAFIDVAATVNAVDDDEAGPDEDGDRLPPSR